MFGAVFNQWLNQWPTGNAAGWLIGAGIMGPRALAAGKTCLRDMAAPGAAHCLSPQPSSYQNFDPTLDVHENSGIGNRAFAIFAQSVGGNAWSQAIEVWYDACVDSRLGSTATYADFAALTLDAASKRGGNLPNLVSQAWQTVAVTVGPPPGNVAAASGAGGAPPRVGRVVAPA